MRDVYGLMFWFPISLRIKRGYVPIFRLLLFCFASFFFFLGSLNLLLCIGYVLISLVSFMALVPG